MKLLVGRIDIAPIEMVVGYTLIHKLFPPSRAAMLTNHPKPIADEHYYLIISKDLPPVKQKKLMNDFIKA